MTWAQLCSARHTQKPCMHPIIVRPHWTGDLSCILSIVSALRAFCAGTKIGLPELQLGIIPGFGGTQRLPRLVGLQQGLQMMLTSAPISAKAALASGLVDAVVPMQELLPKARAMALDIANLKVPRKKTLQDTSRIGALGEAEAIIAFAREEAVKRAGECQTIRVTTTMHADRGSIRATTCHSPLKPPSAGPLQHPQLCIDAVEFGVRNGGLQGLKAEADAFGKAMSLPVHAALVHMFFAQRTTKNVRPPCPARSHLSSCVALLCVVAAAPVHMFFAHCHCCGTCREHSQEACPVTPLPWHLRLWQCAASTKLPAGCAARAQCPRSCSF
jgi:enoyl-CoA hydratase/carnithine racemase